MAKIITIGDRKKTEEIKADYNAVEEKIVVINGDCENYMEKIISEKLNSQLYAEKGKKGRSLLIEFNRKSSSENILSRYYRMLQCCIFANDYKNGDVYITIPDLDKNTEYGCKKLGYEIKKTNGNAKEAEALG